MKEGVPVVPEEACTRTTSSIGAAAWLPSGGSRLWLSLSSAFSVKGSRARSASERMSPGSAPASASFAAWKDELAFRYSSCRRSFPSCIAAVSSADMVSTAALK